MTKILDVFCEIPCLTEQSYRISGIALQKKWFKSADKRVIGQYLQKFIDYNSEQFKFLGVQPIINGADQSTTLSFRTSSFIGAIPLRASDTGKQIGDLVVTPRYTGRSRFEDYIEILNLLGNEITPEVADSLPLASGINFRPPLYLEAIKFISSLELLSTKSWRMFDNVEKISNQPTGQINWVKYINSEYKVENRLNFQSRTNVLNEYHNEYAEIKFVFEICKGELLSSNTPNRIKNTIRNKISFLEKRLYNHDSKATNKILIRYSDSPSVKNCKEQANKILNFNLVDSTSWRVNFSDVFEKFIQYIFNEVAKEIGGRVYSNFKLKSRNKNIYSWELKHLEPDAIFQKDNLIVFIDAKYKSNLYNKYSKSDLLKTDHRHDLHQIMAYSSFSNSPVKYGFLCYPSNEIEIKNIMFENSINQTNNCIIVLGVPLKTDSIRETKMMLSKKLNEIIIK